MSTFLENDHRFINALEFLDKAFCRSRLTFTTKTKDIKNFCGTRLEPQVRCKNSQIEGNLRMIESYMPEILFVLAQECNSQISILQAVSNLAYKGFPYPRKEFARTYLQMKMLHFFEAVFFADIFSGIWHGKWENRCFVVKEKAVLQYYHIYNIRDLITLILERYSFTIAAQRASNEFKIGIRANLSIE